jgi:hypothetical protein
MKHAQSQPRPQPSIEIVPRIDGFVPRGWPGAAAGGLLALRSRPSDMNQTRRTAHGIAIGVLFGALSASSFARRGDYSVAAGASPQESKSTGGCAGRSANHRLDFWIGDWLAYAGGALDGTSHIAAILGGCVIQEEWTDVTGYQGRSWFYVDPSTARLKQIWLTSRADEVGGTLEKAELPGGVPGSVRFQGKLAQDSGKQLLDRTTLTLQSDATVRQVIEISRDDGRTWSVKYDAVYRHGNKSAQQPQRK